MTNQVQPSRHSGPDYHNNAVQTGPNAVSFRRERGLPILVTSSPDDPSMKSSRPTRHFAFALLGGAIACATIAMPAHAQTSQGATQTLLERAHTLEVRGRMDMAAQTWQQVLLSDPNNAEALGGLARSAKLSGNLALANTYIERLRAVNPKDPGLARMDSIGAQQNQTAALQQAGKYAEAGQYAQSMAIYRKVFGNTPPPGDWALAYYETESATEEGRPHAVAGLRSLTEKYPADSRYQIALGRILTYNPKTRSEGRRYLDRHPNSPEALKALRQSLVWDSQNPASAPELRAYLAKHSDPQLAAALANQPKPSAATPNVRTSTTGASARVEDSPEVIADRAKGAEMEEAYKSLNAKHIEEAEARFKAILANDPASPRALAGLGYIRMQQSNFGAAISFLEQAKQNGAKDAGLDSALSSARFYSTMSDGAVALNENDLTTAEQQYQAALAMRPTSPEALEGLGGTLLKAQQPEAAVQVYERFVRIKPSTPAAWRGLFMAKLRRWQRSAGPSHRAPHPSTRPRAAHA